MTQAWARPERYGARSRLASATGMSLPPLPRGVNCPGRPAGRREGSGPSQEARHTQPSTSTRQVFLEEAGARGVRPPPSRVSNRVYGAANAHETRDLGPELGHPEAEDGLPERPDSAGRTGQMPLVLVTRGRSVLGSRHKHRVRAPDRPPRPALGLPGTLAPAGRPQPRGTGVSVWGCLLRSRPWGLSPQHLRSRPHAGRL